MNVYLDEDATADLTTCVADATMFGFDIGFYRLLLVKAGTDIYRYGWDEIRIGAAPSP